jgi:hypothetical protein
LFSFVHPEQFSFAAAWNQFAHTIKLLAAEARCSFSHRNAWQISILKEMPNYYLPTANCQARATDQPRPRRATPSRKSSIHPFIHHPSSTINQQSSEE